jgi:integrase/recombinase XerD
MQKEVTTFLTDLTSHHQFSANTILSYRRDLKLAITFFNKQGISEWKDVDEYAVMNLLTALQKQKRSVATINRMISSLRQFFKYMVRQRKLSADPMVMIDHQKAAPRTSTPVILTEKEIEQLLAVPDTNTNLGIRDRAILELMDATGMRVTEVVHLKQADLHLDVKLIQLGGHQHRERIIPLGRTAAHWLHRYLEEVRPHLLGKKESSTIFLNAHGQTMTRQGLWKNFKQWVKQAGIDKRVTPQTIRYSVAVQMLENGANSQVVQEMLGYSELRMLRPYLKVTPQLLTKTYEKYHPRA